MTEKDFPRHVYKKTESGPHTLVVKGEKYFYASECVENEPEFDAALKAGYQDNFNCVLADDEPDEQLDLYEEVEEEDDEF